MCGITGKLNFDRHEPVDPAALRRMMDMVAHRGPDGRGEYLAGPVALGHRRLSIVDLSTGNQPMCNEDGSIWLVFNGEIYNHVELRSELRARGHVFKSVSDTEVILHLYEDLGDDCVTRLQGMFAFALWDVRRQRLLLARDRVGIKPLYYSHTSRALLFGSEIKSLLAEGSIQPVLDLEGIDRFITYYYGPGECTAFKGIHKLPPGHVLTVEAGRTRIHRYWDLQFGPAGGSHALSLDDSAQRLRELLDVTVRQHMMSDVGVGVLLSGGIDSSGILHAARRHEAGELSTFTVGFDDRLVTDERPYARLAARAFGTRHHETTLSAEAFRDYLSRYVWHMEEPICEPPAIALFHVAQLARSVGVKVLLSGEGGDEAFAGYPEYRTIPALERLKSALPGARPLLAEVCRALERRGWQRGNEFASKFDTDFGDYFLSRTSTPYTPFNRLKPQLYGDALAQVVRAGCSEAPTRALHERASGLPILERMLYVDTLSWLPDKLLVKADKMTMATSVELRVPLLDHKLLEFASSLPRSHKVSGLKSKRVLRKALEPYLPPEILRRKKKGFPVPYDTWLRRELAEYTHDTISASGSLVETCLSRPAVQRLLDSNRRSGAAASEVFSLLILNLWHERFFRQQLQSSSAPEADVRGPDARADRLAA